MKSTGWLLIVCLFLAATSQADVVIKKRTTSEGFMGMGGFSMTEVEYTRPDRQCTVKESESGGSPMAAMSTMGNDIGITRLDKGVIWSVNPESKTYSERSIDSFKDEMTQARSNMKDKQGGMKMGGDYEWSFEVLENQGEQEINGFDCTLLKAKGTATDKNDPSKKLVMDMDFWLGQDIPGFNTLEEYNEGFMKASGIGPSGFESMMGQDFGDFGDQYKKIFDAMKESKGYPIRIVTTVTMEGQPGMSGMKDMDWTALNEMAEKAKAGDTSQSAKVSQGAMKQLAEAMSQMKQSQGESGKSPGYTFKTTIEVVSIEEQNVEDSRYQLQEGLTKVSH